MSPDSGREAATNAALERARILALVVAYGVSVNTGANPPPGVRKFVVCP